eukprot:CAMPEP_0172846778 /NCGR_PEP_ID=MMETSP1075-20121228/38559_1 /TAXON_ID=2916 /ORGANISM="Ceratium fusus, Strain PA161109" /LENGTH=51 /DNA_ID=CAMNT_0013691671 /DNA_START=23 /DNA_END=175 /DNA_ORIENTATION=+
MMRSVVLGPLGIVELMVLLIAPLTAAPTMMSPTVGGGATTTGAPKGENIGV